MRSDGRTLTTHSRASTYGPVAWMAMRVFHGALLHANDENDHTSSMVIGKLTRIRPSCSFV